MEEEALAHLVASVSRNVSRRFAGFASRDDLSQECWTWILTHSSKMSEWALLEDVGRRKLQRALYHACTASAQKDKAESLGYKAEDNFHYSVDLIRKCLPTIFENGFDLNAQAYADFADRSLWMDLCGSLQNLPDSEYRLVEMVFSGDPEREDGYAEVAKLLNLEVPAARGRVTRILGKMQRSLGGERPTAHKYEWTGGRRVKLNSQAIAETRNAWDGE